MHSCYLHTQTAAPIQCFSSLMHICHLSCHTLTEVTDKCFRYNQICTHLPVCRRAHVFILAYEHLFCWCIWGTGFCCVHSGNTQVCLSACRPVATVTDITAFAHIQWQQKTPVPLDPPAYRYQHKILISCLCRSPKVGVIDIWSELSFCKTLHAYVSIFSLLPLCKGYNSLSPGLGQAFWSSVAATGLFVNTDS